MQSLKSKLFIYVFFIVFVSIFYNQLLAQDVNFTTDFDTVYEILSTGETLVTKNIVITNKKADIIAASYSISLREFEVYDVQAFSGDRDLEVTQEKDDTTTTISVNFRDYVIGEGRQNKFTIKYKSKNIANKIGQIWNINVPSINLNDPISLYNTQVIIPDELGPKIFISPLPSTHDTYPGKTSYFFTKEDLGSDGISASFGEYQYINFKLKYKLENPNIFPSYISIALPPDIQYFQQVRLKQISPEPIKIKNDEDGNLMADFLLSSKEKREIIVTGTARIAGKQIDPKMGGNKDRLEKYLVDKYTSPQPYWESDNAEIINKAEYLYDDSLNVTQNAKKIYDFVIEHIDYNFNVENDETITRNGALTALMDKGKYACMEYTDLFIALARASGIPARELNGYAFGSLDDKSKPISINFRGGDLLHSWPEFYDPNLGWIQIDPTWGDTASVDYFTKLDTNHLVFSVKGLSSETPLPAGAYRDSDNEKLVEVEFTEAVSKGEFDPIIEINQKFNWNIFKIIAGYKKVEINNKGEIIVYYNGISIPQKGKFTTYVKKDLTEIKFVNFTGEEFVQNIKPI